METENLLLVHTFQLPQKVKKHSRNTSYFKSDEFPASCSQYLKPKEPSRSEFVYYDGSKKLFTDNKADSQSKKRKRTQNQPVQIPRPTNSFLSARSMLQPKLKAMKVTTVQSSNILSNIWKHNRLSLLKYYFRYISFVEGARHSALYPQYRYSPKKKARTKLNTYDTQKILSPVLFESDSSTHVSSSQSSFNSYSSSSSSSTPESFNTDYLPSFYSSSQDYTTPELTSPEGSNSGGYLLCNNTQNFANEIVPTNSKALEENSALSSDFVKQTKKMESSSTVYGLDDCGLFDYHLPGSIEFFVGEMLYESMNYVIPVYNDDIVSLKTDLFPGSQPTFTDLLTGQCFDSMDNNYKYQVPT